MTAPLRVLFFSHDRRGLGHIRRTHVLANLLLNHLPDSNVLIVTGARMAHTFRTRPRLDYVKLPSIAIRGGGDFASSTLDMPLEEIVKMREELLLQTTRLFRPDVLLLGSLPLPENSEIASTVDYVRTKMPRTAIVLSLRDMPDDPARMAESWERHSMNRMLGNDYDRILIHGSRRVYDVPHKYGFDDKIKSKTIFCGYVPRSLDSVSGEAIRKKFCTRDHHKLLVITVGGGIDGASLIEQCLVAVSSDASLNNIRVIAILGPEMPAENSAALRAQFSDNINIILFDFVESLSDYLAAADVIVSMGGYNTLCEIIALRKHAIVVPRVHQSTEQLVRARRFAELGLVKMLHPDDADSIQIARAIADAVSAPLVHSENLDFGDSSTFACAIQEIASSRSCEVVHE